MRQDSAPGARSSLRHTRVPQEALTSSGSDPWTAPEQGSEVEQHPGCGPGSRGVGRKAPTAAGSCRSGTSSPGPGWALLRVSSASVLGCPAHRRSAPGKLSAQGLSFPFCRRDLGPAVSGSSTPQPLPGAERDRSHAPACQRPRSQAGPAGGGGLAGSGPAPSPSRGTGAPGHSPGPEAPSVTQASWKRHGGCGGLPANPLGVPPPTASLSHHRPFSYARWALTPVHCPSSPEGPRAPAAPSPIICLCRDSCPSLPPLARPSQSKHGLSSSPGRVSRRASSGLHCSLASCLGADLLGIAMRNSVGARGSPQ